MSTFKNMIKNDLKEVFFNVEELCEEHIVEGKKIVCALDSDALAASKAGSDLAIAESDVLLLAQVKDLPKRKSEGASLNVDGREYIVNSWLELDGMASVYLAQTRVRGG